LSNVHENLDAVLSFYKKNFKYTCIGLGDHPIKNFALLEKIEIMEFYRSFFSQFGAFTTRIED
jgi:hypothetical protein